MNQTVPNPGLLKLDLALRGTRLDDSVRQPLDALRVSRARDGAGSNLELILPEDVLVSIPLEERFAQHTPYVLSAEGERFWVATNGERCEVRIVPPPVYYEKTTRSGLALWRVGTVYGGHIAINPAAACGLTRTGVPCRFCHAGARVEKREAPLEVADVVETVDAAFAEGVIEFVYLHIGHVQGDDAGASFLQPYVHAIKKHFDTLVAVQLAPPADNHWIDRTYAMGVDALSYSVEIHDPELFRRYGEGRGDQVGRERYYEALAYAASIFPSGTVWSDLIIGVEPVESTCAGIDTLVRMGVLPVLSLVPPPGDTPPPDHPLANNSGVASAIAHLFNAVRQAKINMHWIRDLNYAITPLEARFFAGDEARNSVTMGSQFYRSRLGNLAARNLSRMRRRLRVRKVSDSFDSSHL